MDAQIRLAAAAWQAGPAGCSAPKHTPTPLPAVAWNWILELVVRRHLVATSQEHREPAYGRAQPSNDA